ncbi:hypothetical protein VP01_6935g2 [Puccinia sorghi]|uniref:Uncharacterized protein n=1 Tax=Puccinia sorghi TaxID=27349 RepID=A0A0L6UG94_9BASI|nr:hypothetical protein VP01_6935g2 [Puccinia sorghi]
MAALKTFRECVAEGAYTYMNVNKGFVDDFELSRQAYKHYVHFTWLRDKRYKFAVNNNFPKRYLEVIKPVQDEYFPEKDVYIVKKLPFRSEAATTFFRQLDLVIKKSEVEDGKKKSSPRRRLRVKNAPNTIFPKAPKGMPLDFYDV